MKSKSDVALLDMFESDIRFSQLSTIIVKTTHRCNLSCSYCYEHIATGEDMPIETFKRLVNRIIRSIDNKLIRIIFLGGEPTLVKNGWYSEAINYAQNLAVKYQKEIKFTMQTNFINVNKEKLSLYKSLNIGVGVSIDGPTKYSGMRGNSDRVVENIFLAQSLGMNVGILTTINQHNYNHFYEISEWFQNYLKIKKYKANVVGMVGAGVSLTPLNYLQIFEAYKSIIDYTIDTNGLNLIEDNTQIEINRFFSNKEIYEDHSNTLCRTRNCGACSKVIGVTPEGNILPCGRFQWNDDSFVLGNINNQYNANDISDFRNKSIKFHSSYSEVWNSCHNCSAKKICSYGCRAFIFRSEEKINNDCLPTKSRYYYLCKRSVELGVIYETWKAIGNLTKYFNNYSDHSDHHHSDSKYDDDSWYDYNHSDYSDYDDYREGE